MGSICPFLFFSFFNRMKPRTFSPNIIHRTPVEIPKVVKQDYSLEAYKTFQSEDDEEDDNDDDNDDDEEWDDERGEEEILNDYLPKNKHPVVIKKRSLTPPLSNYLNFSSISSSKSSNLPNFDTTDYMNKMTLDLMMNPHYLSKANPEAFQRKIEQAQRILKHRRDIYKTFGDCFDALENLVHENKEDNIDLDVQTGFLHFAKTVLLNIQQQNAGKSEKEPIFSVCNDVHSSFFTD